METNLICKTLLRLAPALAVLPDIAPECPLKITVGHVLDDGRPERMVVKVRRIGVCLSLASSLLAGACSSTRSVEALLVLTAAVVARPRQ